MVVLVEVKCKRCGKLFLTESPDRMKFPLCAECLLEFHKWLETERVTTDAIKDDIHHKKEWAKNFSTGVKNESYKTNKENI